MFRELGGGRLVDLTAVGRYRYNKEGRDAL